MEELSSWVAPIATAIAACMTASNLGSRVTGWGFVVFTIGSIAWTTYGLTTGQSNLLWQNLFLTAVNLIGVWRWLGRQAKFDEGAKAAAEKSRHEDAPTLFAVSSLLGAPLTDRKGEPIGKTIDAMARCKDGGVAYLVVGKGGVGGVGETLHMLQWSDVAVTPETVSTTVDLGQLAPLDPTDWPATARARAGARSQALSANAQE